MDKPRTDILHIEDNNGDARLVMEHFKSSGIKCNYNVCTNGTDAILLLDKITEQKGATAPDFIMLDLNLPKVSGFEILEKLKKEDALKEIPVVIFSSSD